VALAQYKQEMREALEAFDHYEHGMRVLDTDYKNYLLLYHCIEDYPDAVPDETAADVHSKLKHDRSISILLRDPATYTDFDGLISNLMERVPGVNFRETHNIIDHSSCPSGDIFQTAGALNVAELKESLMSMEDDAEKARHEDL
jgi:hypothetical protein